jgi:hypothetical protein
VILSLTNKPFAATAAKRPAATRALLVAAAAAAVSGFAGSQGEKSLGGNTNAGGLG